MCCQRPFSCVITRRGFWPIAVATKLLLVLVVLGALHAPFNLAQFQDAYANWPSSGKADLTSRFATWDVAHYLILSQRGYQAGSHSCAFYPLWPMLLRGATVVTGGRPVLAAMLLANALSLVGLWMLYRLVERHYGAAISRDALILLLACPGALFFSFPYSESLFLVLLMAFFWGLERGRWGWTAVAGFLLPLSRPVGVFVLLPLAWFFWERGWPRWPVLRRAWERFGKATAGLLRRRGTPSAAGSSDAGYQSLPQPGFGETAGGDEGQSGAARLPLGFRPWLLLSAPLLGYALYFGLMYVWTGNALEGFAAQKAYPNSPSIKNMIKVAGFTEALLNIGSLDGMMDGLLDRAFFVVVLLALPRVWRLNRVWFWYVLSAGLVPALTSWFMSYRRYVVVLFPVFIVLARLLAQAKSRWLFWYYVVGLAALQAWAVKQFVNFNWAG